MCFKCIRYSTGMHDPEHTFIDRYGYIEKPAEDVHGNESEHEGESGNGSENEEEDEDEDDSESESESEEEEDDDSE